MAALEIKVSGDPVLRQKAHRVTGVDPRLTRLIDDMVETLESARGLGLAAPQVGSPLRLAVIRLPEDSEEPEAGRLIVLINPEIVKSEGECELEEGCLSVPGFVGTVKRAERVTVKARDGAWKPYRVKANGLLAQALQHEIDHLNGVLYFDLLVEGEVLRPIGESEGETGTGGSAASRQ